MQSILHQHPTTGALSEALIDIQALRSSIYHYDGPIESSRVCMCISQTQAGIVGLVVLGVADALGYLSSSGMCPDSSLSYWSTGRMPHANAPAGTMLL